MGDVRDYSSVERAMRGVDYVFQRLKAGAFL
jgi:FlaA1/EpsC-like NDP-sugar epimerase